MKRDKVVGCFIVIPASLAATGSLSQPVEIGRVETAVPAVESDTVGVVSQLEPGSEIFQDSLIRTYKIGAAGLRFLDQTTLTVYPNSSVKLDRFIYNPDKTVSEVGLSLLRGAFRLASGGPRTSEKYKIQTPHATLGIRGTVIHLVSDESSSIVQALHGAFEGCSSVSGECKLVRASDTFNGARFWNDGRIELGRFSPNLGLRAGSLVGSPAASQNAQIALSAIDSPRSNVASPPEPRRSSDESFPAALADVPFFASNSAPAANPSFVICFVRGTLILTTEGEKKIEELRIGDELVTGSAARRKVKWIPKQIFRRAPGRVWSYWVAPVAIEKDAIAEGCPHRTLILSPNHSLFLEDVLIPARLLVNGSSIRRIDYSGQALEYWNIELQEHQVIYANGVAVETYRPAEERAREHWSNFSQYCQTYPGQEYRMLAPIAPVLTGGRGALVKSRVMSFASALVDRRGTLELVRDQLARRAHLLRSAGRRNSVELQVGA